MELKIGILLISKTQKYRNGKLLDIKGGKYFIDQGFYGIAEIGIDELNYHFYQETLDESMVI